jgi:hypothetical protein
LTLLSLIIAEQEILLKLFRIGYYCHWVCKKSLTGCSNNDVFFLCQCRLNLVTIFVMGKFCDANLAAKIDASRGCASEI